MSWFIVLGIFVYLFCSYFTYDILRKTYFFEGDATPFSVFWPIFWTIYFSYHILTYPVSFFAKGFDKFTTFVAERMN